MCKKPIIEFSDMVDSIQTNDPTCFLRHLEYITDDFRGPGALWSGSARIFHQKSRIFDQNELMLQSEAPRFNFN